MRRVAALYRSTVGKKAMMAGTGILLLLYVVAHMLGNLKVYQGPTKYNEYAEWLREMGAPVLGHAQGLWIVRIVLLAAVVIHVVAAVQLARRSRGARSVGYRNTPHEEFSYASRTMRWGGLVIFLFVVYHLLHLTWGTAHGDFVQGDVYHNFVTGFSSWPVSLAYIAANLVLALHIYHGIWSASQTLGVQNPRWKRWRRPVAGAVAGLILVGNVSFPVAVLAGILGPA